MLQRVCSLNFVMVLFVCLLASCEKAPSNLQSLVGKTKQQVLDDRGKPDEIAEVDTGLPHSDATEAEFKAWKQTTVEYHYYYEDGVVSFNVYDVVVSVEKRP